MWNDGLLCIYIPLSFSNIRISACDFTMHASSLVKSFFFVLCWQLTSKETRIYFPLSEFRYSIINLTVFYEQFFSTRLSITFQTNRIDFFLSITSFLYSITFCHPSVFLFDVCNQYAKLIMTYKTTAVLIIIKIYKYMYIRKKKNCYY